MYFLHTFHLTILLRDDWSDQMQGATTLLTHLRVSEFFSFIRLAHWMQRNGGAILQTEIETSIVLQRMSLQTETMCKIFSYIQFWHGCSLPTHHCLRPQRCAHSCLLLAQHHLHPQCCPCSHSSTFQTHIRHPCISVLVFFFQIRVLSLQSRVLSLQSRALSLLRTWHSLFFSNSCVFHFSRVFSLTIYLKTTNRRCRTLTHCTLLGLGLAHPPFLVLVPMRFQSLCTLVHFQSHHACTPRALLGRGLAHPPFPILVLTRF